MRGRDARTDVQLRKIGIVPEYSVERKKTVCGNTIVGVAQSERKWSRSTRVRPWLTHV